ncbi:MAG: VOC family protein [Chloroflexota bacterium]
MGGARGAAETGTIVAGASSREVAPAYTLLEMASTTWSDVAEPAVKVRHIRHVGLSVPDPIEASRFYEEVWGLRHVDSRDGVVFLRAAGTESHVLELHAAPHKGIHHLALEVDGYRAVDAAAERLREHGIKIVNMPHHLEEPGGGYGLGFVDPENRLVELIAESDPLPEANWNATVVPNKISHTVINTVDIDAANAFYTRVLGFRVSDWSEHQMVFLRCNTDHHSIAFNQAPHASLNHIAYELPSIDDVMRGIGSIQRAGRTQIWGPGRHGPGNNVFCYFQDPAGLVCEYTSDVEQIRDERTWVARIWPRVPELSDRWGTSGAPSAAARIAMTGEPDPGFAATCAPAPDAHDSSLDPPGYH